MSHGIYQDPNTEFDLVARDVATRMADLRERGFSADDCRGWDVLK